MSRSLILACLALIAIAAVAGPAAAENRFFSYDPANPQTRKVAGDLTFEFHRKLVWNVVVSVRSTEGEATADLRPVSGDGALGASLARIVGPSLREHDLYEVTPTAQGAELTHAFCPGSSRAWMAFGKLAEGEPLRVRVLGDTPGGGPAHLCQTFDFSFHGEWVLPHGAPPPERDLLVPHFPY